MSTMPSSESFPTASITSPSAAMHQGHNIPWDILSSNFRFVENDTSFTPPRTGLKIQDTPNGPKELKHFIKKFVHAITTFSETERSKYPTKFTPLTEGKLFSDELLQKYPHYLDEHSQKIDSWIKRANPRYTTSDACLAEVVKILLYENELPTLLMLAQHPSIAISQLHHLSWGHHFGWSRVKESAVRSYLFFNSAEATGTLDNGKYAKSIEFSSLLNELATQMDYPAQQVPHRQFLEGCGLLERNQSLAYLSKLECPERYRIDEHYPRLQEYLKQLFALMYRYDALARECGVEPRWEEEIALNYPLRDCVDLSWDEETEKYVLA